MGLICGGGSFIGEAVELREEKPVTTMAEEMLIRHHRKRISGYSIGGARGPIRGARMMRKVPHHCREVGNILD